MWGRRLALEASDLVRFSRTYRYWRNAQVDMLDADGRCRDQLTALVDGQAARDRAGDAGVRELAHATVVATSPLRLDVGSRRLGDGTRAVLLHGPGGPALEGTADLKVQAGASSWKECHRPADRRRRWEGLLWQPLVIPTLSVGDALVIGEADWFSNPYRSGHELAVKRPQLDGLAAPKSSCEPDSYETDPDTHQWCCRPHLAAEAQWSDEIAERRSRGELNPEVWPPVIDEDRFDPVDEADPVPGTDPGPIPEGLTLDDVD